MFSKSLHSIAALGGAVAVLGASALFGAPAHALPPGGAGSDTPGTSSYVSPTTLKACDTISYSVSGFPAGEIVYIKIDDGSVSSGDPSIQGQGVVAQQRIDSSGTASGSFSLPCDLPAGEHWLRYLASENSSAGGTIGYTNSGNSTFTIVSASSNSDDSSSTTTASTSTDSTTTAASSGGSNNSNRSAAVTQETVNAQGERVVVTRYVDEPAEAGAAAAAAGNNNNSGGSSGSTNSTNSTNAATLRLGGASSGSGSTGSGNAVTTDGGTVVVASGANGKPVIGLLVGGAILIVGLLAVGAYLHVNKPRTSRGGENGNF